VLFVVVLAALWVFWVVDRARSFRAELRTVQSVAEDHANWFALEASIRERYEAALVGLPPNPPTGPQAYAVIDQIVRKHGLAFRFDQPKPTKAENLTLHPITVNVFKAKYKQLEELFTEITTALPTVNLDEVKIAMPDRSNFNVLDAQFKFVAIEIHR